MPAFRCLLLAFFLLGAPIAAHAQNTPPPETAIWIPPAPDQTPIRLEQVRIDIRTEGFLARTRIEVSFFNPNARVLEGEFVFPLAAGQTVAGYELEVDGRMREGVVVPKETARVAFENTIRQQIDPGLAELTRGNVFRTRLYPIPAQGRKRVALIIEQALEDGGDHYRYLLPLAFRQSVQRFEVHAEALRRAGAPIGIDASPDANLRFDRAGDHWSATLTRENVQPQRELAFRIPKAGDEETVLEAPDALDPAWRSVVAQLDTGFDPRAAKARKPRRIALWIDASGSARERDRARERAALQAYFAQVGDVDVDLVAFRNVAEAPQRFRIAQGDARVLLDAIEALPLDGGSSYGAIDPAKTPGADTLIVIGDGLSNFGGHEATAPSPASAIVHVLHAAQRADHARLARIARRGGGQVIDLLRTDSTGAVAALTHASWQLNRIRAVGGECSDVSPRAPAAVGARLNFTARCRGRGSLELEFGAGARRVVRQIGFGTRAPVAESLDAAVHRLWAAAQLAELEAEAAPDRAALTALATRYGVVTADTSLLVLDRIEDYVRYRVEPKEPELRQQYRALLATQPKEAAEDAEYEQRIARLAAQWKEFRDWHATRHPWLETLLAPAADAELVFWTRIADSDQKSRARAKAAQAVRDRSHALVARWRVEGADDAARVRWEREATALMLQTDALRRERLKQVPGSAAWNAEETLEVRTEPVEASLARDASGVASEEDLERIEVTGSRIAEAPAAEAGPVVFDEATPMAVAAPPPAPPADAAPADRAVASQAAGAGQSADTAVSAPPQARIELASWNPDTPYLAAIRAAKDPYAAYLREREQHGNAPAFFIDCADHFREQLRDPALGLRILSNLAELGLEETALVRVLAYRLVQWNEFALAVGQFEEALQQRPEEPQSHRDLALARARLPAPDVERSIEGLWRVASGVWDARFAGVELIALHELNDVLAMAPDRRSAKLDALRIPAELLEPVPVGLRVVMTWDADNTDIDLWVTDPVGARVYYGESRSPSGGHVSQDLTQGYGPEVYTIRRPVPGTYRVHAHYFAENRQSLTGPVTVQVEFQTGYGTSGSKRQAVTRRLEADKEDLEIGSFTVE